MSFFMNIAHNIRKGAQQRGAFALPGHMAKEFTNGLYKSAAWRSCREAYAKSVGYLCEDCMAKGIYTPGEIVHHIIEIDPVNITNPEILLSFDNLRLVCRKCHGARHSKVGRGRRYAIADDGSVIIDPNTPPWSEIEK